MTMFAGVYQMSDGQVVDPVVRQRLLKAMSRNPRNSVREFTWRSAYLVHLDVGALGYSSVTETDTGGVVAVGGQIISDHRPINDRHHEILRLGGELMKGEHAGLLRARGTFCAVAYEPRPHRIVLAVDRLGVRPIYWWSNGRLVVFSTALRIFETLADHLNLRVDTVALAEACAFEYPLGTATPFHATHCLRPAQTVTISNGSRPETVEWFRWDRVQERSGADAIDLAMLRDTFLDAVRLRLGSDRVSQAFLSGGLDSRSIATTLAATAETLYTYNFSWPGSYDQVLGTAYAQAIGAVHHEAPLPTNVGGEAWPRMIAQALEAHTPGIRKQPERPRVVWAGDGGSVGVGRVYLTDEMLSLMRQGNRPKAAEAFLRLNPAGIPKRLLRSSFEPLASAPMAGMARELASIRCLDPAKDLLVFLLENDQRRHLAGYYEDLDLNRVEYQLPFFDAVFLETAVSFPIDDTLYHRLYNRWLSLLPGPAATVPWQAYVGHEACPLPLPQGGTIQWRTEATRRPLATELREAALRFRQVLSSQFPASIFSRSRTLAAAVLGLLRMAETAYVFPTIQTFGKYYALCRGRLD